MAQKHFEEYYIRVAQDYEETKQMLEEFLKAFKEGVVSEERVKIFSDSAAYIRNNFELLKKVNDLLALPEDYDRNKDSPIAFKNMDEMLSKGEEALKRIKETIEENGEYI